MRKEGPYGDMNAYILSYHYLRLFSIYMCIEVYMGV